MKTKPFDCVEMKNQIQAELLSEYEGLSEDEIRKRRHDRIHADPILSNLVNRVGARDVEKIHGTMR